MFISKNVKKYIQVNLKLVYIFYALNKGKLKVLFLVAQPLIGGSKRLREKNLVRSASCHFMTA